MSYKTLAKTSLVASAIALTIVQLQTVLIKHAIGVAPLTSPLTTPLTSPISITPTPSDTPPLTLPVQTTPTPTHTPNPKPNDGNNNSNNGNNSGGSNNGGGPSNNNGGGSNVCTNETPKSAPLLLSIKKTNKTTVTLTWIKGWGPVNGYIVWYGQTKDAAEYSTGTILGEEQVKSYSIAALNPKIVYYFKIQPKNGCKTGALSNVIASNGKTVVSYGFTQGITFSAKSTVPNKKQSTTTQNSQAIVKTQSVFEKLNGFMHSFFK